MTLTTIDAILPAGGRLEGEFAREAGAGIKALIRVGDVTVLEHTIRVLRATGRIGRIVVIGPSELGLHPATRDADAVLAEGDSGPDNILRGIDWLEATGGAAGRALILTTDLPFLTPEAVNTLLDACPEDVEVCIPVIRSDELHRRFPDSPAFFVHLRDGQYAIGCGFVVDPDAIRRNRGNVLRIYRARKSEMAMARLLGPSFVLKYLTRRLCVADIQRRCCDIIGCSGAAVRGCPPELAADIDTLEEYRFTMRETASAFQHEVPGAR